MSNPISLTQMPKELMEHISESLDFQSILVLRKVCKDLRNFIDDTKPASRLTDIRINVRPEYILCTLESQSQNEIRIFYEKCSEGCLLKKCHKYEEIKRTILEDEDFVTVFCKDFNIILRHQKNALDYFKTTFYSSNPTVLEKVLESVKKSFESMNHLLPVKTLDMVVRNHNEILSTLPYMDPKPLESIIFNELTSKKDDKMLNFDKIGQLEQWKQAENLAVLGFQITNLSQNIKHFSRINHLSRKILTEELVLLKEIFLSSSTLTVIKIHNDDPWYPVVRERLIEAFGEPLVGTDHNRIWFFKIPDTNQFLKMRLSYRDICFQRIKQSDVPQNARISN